MPSRDIAGPGDNTELVLVCWHVNYQGQGEGQGEPRGELTRGCMHQAGQEGQCQQQQLQHLDTVRSSAGPVGGEG